MQGLECKGQGVESKLCCAAGKGCWARVVPGLQGRLRGSAVGGINRRRRCSCLKAGGMGKVTVHLDTGGCGNHGVEPPAVVVVGEGDEETSYLSA